MGAKGKRNPKHNWEKIRTAFIESPIRLSTRALSAQFGPRHTMVFAHMKKEKWEAAREEHWNTVRTKREQKTTDEQAIEIARTINIVNAIDELNRIAIENIQAEIDAAKAIKNPKARATKIKEILARDDVQAVFIGSTVLDKNARLKKYLRGEADVRTETISHDEAREIWKVGRKLKEQKH